MTRLYTGIEYMIGIGSVGLTAWVSRGTDNTQTWTLMAAILWVGYMIAGAIREHGEHERSK